MIQGSIRFNNKGFSHGSDGGARHNDTRFNTVHHPQGFGTKVM